MSLIIYLNSGPKRLIPSNGFVLVYCNIKNMFISMVKICQRFAIGIGEMVILNIAKKALCCH